MYEIIDNNGTIHSGTEEEMETAFFCMTNSISEIMEYYELNKKQAIELKNKYETSWDGDLKFIQVLDIHR